MRISDWSSDVCSSDLAAHIDQHVIEGVDTQIRHPQRTGSDTTTGQIDRAKAGALCQQRMIGVDGANHLQWCLGGQRGAKARAQGRMAHDRPSGGNRSEEHPSELQSLMRISYGVLFLKKNT